MKWTTLLQAVILFVLLTTFAIQISTFRIQDAFNNVTNKRLAALEACPCEPDHYARR